jgi:hypothetical protein
VKVRALIVLALVNLIKTLEILVICLTLRLLVPKLKNKKVVSTKVPKHARTYIERYAIKGLRKQVRQEVTNNWYIHESKKLRALSVDRFFRKHFFKGSKWNQKLEKAKINAQLRILDPLDPLSVLWAEAEHIRDNGQGMALLMSFS